MRLFAWLPSSLVSPFPIGCAACSLVLLAARADVAKRDQRKRRRKLRPLTAKRVPAKGSADVLWSKRRAGARNIAGVRYQLRLTLSLLVRSARGVFPASALRPEGLEDIDSVPTTGERRCFIQAKEIADEDAFVGVGLLADFIAHVAPVLIADVDAVAALVTNARFGGGLTATGWSTCLDPDADLVAVIAASMQGMQPDEVEQLLQRVHLVEDEADLTQAFHDLAEFRAVDPAISQLAVGRSLATVMDLASEQADRTVDEPVALTLADLDDALDVARRAAATAALSQETLRRVVSPLSLRTRSSLTETEFLFGVDVKPEHIAAGLDLRREDHLDEIGEGLNDARLVVIVGPSGAGKSALLWRTAADHAERMRVWRVHELGEGDVDLVVAAISQQRPSDRYPVLVCVDDIGRPTRSGWRAAAEALLEMPGVYVVGAAREEDFAAADALRRALIVRPILSRTTAIEIDRVLRLRGIEPVMAVDEAFESADGLLMEFLQLMTEGKRLAAVLAEQAEALEAPSREVELAVVRLVASAHMVGLDVPSSELQTRVGGSSLATALRRLEREHLLVESQTGTWTGLHELRSTQLAADLHKRPPPRLADTLGLVLEGSRADVASARLPAIVRAAGEIGPMLTTLQKRISLAPASELTAWLEGARMADIAEHARACADTARRLDLPESLNPAEWVNLAHISRFGGVDLSILPDAFHALAKQLPDPPQKLHRELVAALLPSEWVVRVLDAEPEDRPDLLEALETGVEWDERSAAQLALAITGTDALLDARTIASAYRACADDAARTALVSSLPTLTQRLTALRDAWPLLTDADFDASKRIARTRFVHGLTGNESPEHQAAELAAVVLDLLPEAAEVEVTVTRYDGADLPILGRTGPHKAIPRENLPSQAVTRWNRAFADHVEREFSSVSLTMRLRQQAALLRLAEVVVLGLIERMLRFDADEQRHIRRWATAATQFQRDVAALAAMPAREPVALAPLGSPPKTRSDDVAQAVEHVSMAATQFADAFGEDRETRKQRMRLVGSQLRDAMGYYRTAVQSGTARFVGEPDPLPVGLMQVLEDAATVAIGYADDASIRTPPGRFTSSALASVASCVREQQTSQELENLRVLLDDVPGLDLTLARLVSADERPGMVADPRRWLIPTPPSEVTTVVEAMLREVRAATIAHPLSFRVIVAPAEAGALFNYTGTVIGAKDAFPIIDLDGLQSLAAEAQLPLHPGTYVQEVAECIEALVRASRAGAAATAMAGTAQEAELKARADTELQRARAVCASVENENVAMPVRLVLEATADELVGVESGALASEFDDVQDLRAGMPLGPRLLALEAAVQAAALA